MVFFVLPVYNEEKSLPDVITQIRTLMRGKEYKIIAVNDGSSDGSLAVLSQLGGSDIEVENFIINMNIGAVFSSGIDRAINLSRNENDIVIIMESDQTSELGLVEKLIYDIEKGGKDVSIASRYRQGGGYVNFPLMRSVFSYCANQLLRSTFPIPEVTDYTIFFRAYRIGVINKAIKCFGKYGLIQSKGFVANAELLIKLSAFTDRVSEVPFIYNYASKVGNSKIRIFRTINEYLSVIFYLKRIFFKLNRFKDKIS